MKRFSLFDMNRPGKGLTKEQASKGSDTGLYGFFRLYKDRFWTLSTLNILFVLSNFPIFFGFAALSENFNVNTTAPASPLYAQLFGIMQYGNTPFTAALYSVFGGNGTLSVPTTTTRVLGWLTLLIVLTVGLSNVGAACVMRGFVRGEPVFVLSDYWQAIKKNWKQGLLMGIVDSLLLFVFAYGIMTYYINTGTYAFNVMLAAEVLLFLIYLTMRFYIYLILITFDLSLYKILKNAFIFSVIGFKRNILAWLGILLVIFFNLFLFFNLTFLGVALPFVITVITVKFITAFAAYPVIQKYMIDPQITDKKTASDNADAGEPIFTDRG